MIKINFLTSFKDYASAQAGGSISYVDEDERKQVLIEVAKRLLIIAIGPLGLYIYEMQTIPALNDQINQLNVKIKEMKQSNDSKEGLSQEIKKFEDEQARFNAQMDFINRIQADKINEYKLFKLLQEATPASVWINEMSFLDNTLQIRGESIEPADISRFTQILSNTDFLTPPIPLGQSVQPNFRGSGTETITFDLKSTLSTNAGEQK